MIGSFQVKQFQVKQFQVKQLYQIFCVKTAATEDGKQEGECRNRKYYVLHTWEYHRVTQCHNERGFQH